MPSSLQRQSGDGLLWDGNEREARYEYRRFKT